MVGTEGVPGSSTPATYRFNEHPSAILPLPTLVEFMVPSQTLHPHPRTISSSVVQRRLQRRTEEAQHALDRKAPWLWPVCKVSGAPIANPCCQAIVRLIWQLRAPAARNQVVLLRNLGNPERAACDLPVTHPVKTSAYPTRRYNTGQICHLADAHTLSSS